MTFPRFYPPAERRIIPAGASDPKIVPAVVSLHVTAGTGSPFNYFNGPSGGIESHLYLSKRGKWEQYRQFHREADAQLGGNSWDGLTVGRDGLKRNVRLGAITIETEGRAGGWWTRRQKREIKKFLLWARENLGVPLTLVKVPNPRTVDRGGVGYHSLFDQWNSLRKSCPGPRRVAWFRKKLVPWMVEQNRRYHTVTKDDSINRIAGEYGVSVAQLWRWNRPGIKPGEKLRVR